MSYMHVFTSVYSHLQFRHCSYDVYSTSMLLERHIITVFIAILHLMHRDVLPMYVMLMETLNHVSGVL